MQCSILSDITPNPVACASLCRQLPLSCAATHLCLCTMHCSQMLNPASMKQALVEGAARLGPLNQLEQGSGRVDLAASYKVLANYTPRASLHPGALDFTDCPYMWPHCRQPLYAFAQPLVYNATILNGMGVIGKLVGTPTFEPSDEGGKLLHVTFAASEVLWPWTGALAVYVEVRGRMPRGREMAFCYVA